MKILKYKLLERIVFSRVVLDYSKLSPNYFLKKKTNLLYITSELDQYLKLKLPVKKENIRILRTLHRFLIIDYY